MKGRYRVVSGVEAGVSFGLLGLLLVAIIIFWPALDGPFVFDDFHNLEKLGQNGGIQSLDDLIAFVFSGSSALGRPISFLSFAINDQAWPSDPFVFKYTNLMLHLLNGVLVFLFARQIFALDRNHLNSAYGALAVAALWLLHPMQLSTMMLTVQRMVLLMSGFTLLGLISYTRGRLILSERPRTGYACMTLGIVVGGCLATLSKENGVLLPLYVLILEATLFARYAQVDMVRYFRLWKGVFLVAPLVLLAGYFLLIPDKIEAEYARRSFTLMERLLTEPRILLDYLKSIIFPRLKGGGLFHDDIVVSTGLFSPVSTVVAIAALAVAAAFALVMRKRFAFAAFAVLWFLAGHALESTFLWLELYFEHRNYLPMLGLFVFIVWMVGRAPPKGRRAAVVGMVAYLCLEVFLSWQSSMVWGSEHRLVQTWSRENPKSLRAQQLAASYWNRLGHEDLARQRLALAQHHHPEDLSVILQISLMDCDAASGTEAAQNAVSLARGANYNDTVFGLVTSLRRVSGEQGCSAWPSDRGLALLNNLLSNPAYVSTARTHGFLLYELGMLAITVDRPGLAVASLSAAYCERREPQIVRYLVGYLIELEDHVTASRITSSHMEIFGDDTLDEEMQAAPLESNSHMRGDWSDAVAGCVIDGGR